MPQASGGFMDIFNQQVTAAQDQKKQQAQPAQPPLPLFLAHLWLNYHRNLAAQNLLRQQQDLAKPYAQRVNDAVMEEGRKKGYKY